jgi:hypothetical protein
VNFLVGEIVEACSNIHACSKNGLHYFIFVIGSRL